MNLPTYIYGNTQTRGYAVLRRHVYSVLSKYDLTPTHWAMLGIIIEARDGVRQVEIARALNIKAPLITLLARELIKRKIINSVVNQFDSRAKLLSTTPYGKKYIKTVEKDLFKQLSKLLNGLTEEDLITYHKVLQTIITNDNRLLSTG